MVIFCLNLEGSIMFGYDLMNRTNGTYDGFIKRKLFQNFRNHVFVIDNLKGLNLEDFLLFEENAKGISNSSYLKIVGKDLYFNTFRNSRIDKVRFQPFDSILFDTDEDVFNYGNSVLARIKLSIPYQDFDVTGALVEMMDDLNYTYQNKIFGYEICLYDKTSMKITNMLSSHPQIESGKNCLCMKDLVVH